jgi:hypothetical protein
MIISNPIIQPLKDDFAPYASTGNVMDVILRKRDRGLPNPITSTTLETISIPTGNVSRTLQALKFLGLMDEDGTQTEDFNRLAQAGEAGNAYQIVLEEILRHSYERVFAIVDPDQDGDVAIRDAFRQFEPESQRSRMVALFLGLCENAGIVQPKAKQQNADESKPNRSPAQRTRTRSTQKTARQPSTNLHESSVRRGSDEDAEYRLVFAVMQQLPNDRRWSADKRQKWLAAVEAAVDLMVDVVEESRQVPVLMPPRDFQDGDDLMH